MKLSKAMVISVLISVLLVFSLSIAKDSDKPNKKLTVGAYISSAKIEIVSGDLDRYPKAEQYLKDLFYWYGPHAEALYWMVQLQVDYTNKTSSVVDKRQYVEKYVAFVDSLHLCCDKNNKEVKKKYKKKCDDYITLADSIKVDYWRNFYNSGIEIMNNLDDLQNELANETDSGAKANIQAALDKEIEKSAANYELCVLLSPEDPRGYIGLAALYRKVKDYDKTVEWMEKGLEHTDDRQGLLVSTAYDFINAGNYEGAIPYLREYVDMTDPATLSDTLVKKNLIVNMVNLVICYNNAQQFDSAFAMNYRVLEVEPANIDALNSIGHYFGQLSREANDSTRYFREAGQEDVSEIWKARINEYLDSALVYYSRSVEAKSDDPMILELHGVYSSIRGHFEKAKVSFVKLTEMEPETSDHWRTLGDININLKNFPDATAAYEKYIELQPNDKDVLEQLVLLYKELGQNDKAVAAEKKMKALN